MTTDVSAFCQYSYLVVIVQGYVALTQSEGGSQCRQRRNEHGDDDLKKPETFLNPAEIFVCDFILRNYSYLKNDTR